jgi:capsular polysaccharide biosynthesis protein
VEEDRYYDEYEIDLREYIKLLWNNKGIIIGLFILAVLVAGIYSQFYLIPTYQTEARIYAPFFTFANQQELKQTDYLSFMRKPEIESEVINKFDLKKSDQNYTIANLDKKLKVTSNDNSNLVNIKMNGTKPKQMKKVLNFWVDRFENSVIKFLSKRNNAYLSKLENTMNNNKDTLVDKRERLTNFTKNINLGLLKNRLRSKENRIVKIENRIIRLQTDIKKNRSEYKEIKNQLQKSDKFIITKEMISYESLQKLRRLFNEDILLNNLATKSENLNPQYNRLISEKNSLEQDLEVDKVELDILHEEVNVVDKRIKYLQKKVSEKDQELNQIRQNIEIAQKNYQSAEMVYSDAEQLLSQKKYQITVIKNPIVPQSPISPNTKLNIAIARVLSLMLGVFIVFFREFMREEEEEVQESNNKTI